MSEYDKLVLRLYNLSTTGHEQVTLNVKYLLGILERQDPSPPVNGDSGLPVNVSVDVDGGDF